MYRNSNRSNIVMKAPVDPEVLDGLQAAIFLLLHQHVQRPISLLKYVKYALYAFQQN